MSSHRYVRLNIFAVIFGLCGFGLFEHVPLWVGLLWATAAVVLGRMAWQATREALKMADDKKMVE
jgi:hypothetical protein